MSDGERAPSHTGFPRPLYPAPVRDVTVTDPFWLPKLETLRAVTVSDVFDKFERAGALANFDRVAQGQSGGHQGPPWFDGLVCETMRAASDFLAASYDAALDARLDGYIARIAAAQAADPDGYINTFITLEQPDKRWGANGGNQLWSHEEYDAGCLVEAGVHHYRATGKTSLLALAAHFADYMCRYIGPAPKRNIMPSHPLAEEAFLKLYRLLRDEPGLTERVGSPDPRRYLDLVRFWIDNRGNHEGRISFTEYAQDHRPLVEQPEAVGHSVRATLLYTGLVALAVETGAPSYYAASRRLWDDVVERKMFITGGVGPIKEYEGFGYGYYLPNSGYIETCAGVGLAFWASRMNQALGDGACMDVYERVAYNNVLAGVSLAGNRYSYENPLQSRGAMRRWEWHDCPCCPPMLLKLFAEMPGLILAHDGQDIYVNLYIGSRTKVALPAGEVAVALETRYPWDGTVRITLQQEESHPYALRLRIPGWCPGYTWRVNGQPQPAVEPVDGYAALARTWQDGDLLELDLAMPIQRIASHPYVSFTRERVAIQRGPVVYCLDGVDNTCPNDPTLAADPQLRARYRPDLLRGVVAISARDAEGRELLAIPYYAGGNRTRLEFGRGAQGGASDPASRRDWLAVWLKQDDWFRLRQPLDGDERKGWERKLYRPLPQPD